MKKGFFWFIIFFLTSPWFLILLHNRQLPIRHTVTTPVYQFVIDDINVYRGEVSSQVPFVSKLFINKYAGLAKLHFYKYISVYDPHYLFIISDSGVLSPPFSGPLLLGLLPFLIYGFLYGTNKRRLFVFLLLIAPLPAAFLDNPYDIVARIPVFMTLTAWAAMGVRPLRKRHKLLYLIFLILVLFEAARFTHNLVVHYPEPLGEKVYKI